MPDQGYEWRKGSRSNGSGGNNCVEVAEFERSVLVRDSKKPDGAWLEFTRAEWEAFVGSVKDGEFG